MHKPCCGELIVYMCDCDLVVPTKKIRNTFQDKIDEFSAHIDNPDVDAKEKERYVFARSVLSNTLKTILLSAEKTDANGRING